MTIQPTTPEQRVRAMARLEKDVQAAVERAVRELLKTMTQAANQTLTAAGTPTIVGEMFTLGQVHGWWDEAVEREIAPVIMQAYLAGYTATSDAELGRDVRELAQAHMAMVKDRLSRTAQPTIPDQAFAKVRNAIAQSIDDGLSTQATARLIAGELDWTGPPVKQLESNLARLNSKIDAILDPLGPPGTHAREAARLADPRVNELQQARSDIVRQLDADRSVWEQRSETIARTETTGAMNDATNAAGRAEGAQVHMWVATADDRTRDDHLAASGQCVPIDAMFDVGGEDLAYPGDPSGSAWNTINCRCALLVAESCEELGAETTRVDEMIDDEIRDRTDMNNP